MNASTTEITFFSSISEDIDAIAAENESLAFNYRSKQGEREARSQIHTLRKFNGAIDARHRELKAGILEQGRAIDSAKRNLKSRVADMIEVHEAPLKQIEAEAAERAASIQAVFDQIAEIAEAVDPDADSTAIEMAIVAINAVEVSADTCKERLAEAEALRKVVAGETRLGGMLRRANEREEAAAENARLRAEAEERDREERERKIAENARIAAEQKAKAEAEAKDIAIQAERAAAAAREAAAERRVAEAEKNARIAAEAKIVEDKAAAEAAAKAERDAAAARAADEANRKQVMDAIAIDLVANAELSAKDAAAVAAHLATGDCPSVTVSF